ncbi:SDR family oxidoreductase [Nocardia asteroides NBRC 15531]|uniref:NAD(P)H--quinone oxidoreductase n=1 Tax=Nocardia asteroides NBRC 15531 TaxID=1110697 RepID=U5E436_NOCAS|nr:SDR family oxidoreductase [Nocardia asteroides]TLF69539.1 SDR family oxidoreductase [Nocardia asteroides NBRC 15531]UGT49045.1 SDR family oxidoreductase [Nocardia asteroides]SFL78515.1 NAD(P)H dehydrogenase (quinone) [Nocardia asteroides]VEG31181.1 Quinone oxidoreductase 2 [Nocardia asteroides]GAD83597.1 putative NAD(P)H--quinone oxidoreductase [Nocardia asteroides NBRC 15531]
MTVAVTGASGQLGRLVVEALLTAGERPVAIVRDPAKVADLAERGAVVRQASYDDPAALDAALTGVDRVLLVSGNEFGARVAQHTNVVRAAERAGVRLLAYTSIPAATENPMILAQEHRGTEEVLASASIPTVLLRNSWYWENYAAGAAHAAQTGVLAGASGAGKVSGAPRADYAAAAAAVLITDGHEGRVYELGGDEALTGDELAAVIGEVAGKPVRYQDLPEADYAAILGQAGLPEPVAAALADADTGIGRGLLEVRTGDLAKLIGRPVTPPVEAFRALLA